MLPLLFRERIFDTACFLVGRTGRAFGFETKKPVLIIGTGRCGTSLLVDIMESHPNILGFPGEANELWHPKLEPFESSSLDMPPIEIHPEQFSKVSVANWPIQHGERIRDIFTGFQLIAGKSKVLLTKSAMISFMISEILDIFPDARIIHIYRSGFSVVESYFKKNFGIYSRFIYSEKDYRHYCARYWNDCILEIEKRKRELSLETKGQFLEFSYENLCNKPRVVLDDLAKFLMVDPNSFRFDISKISNQNYKVENHAKDTESTELLNIMSPGMKLKGYL